MFENAESPLLQSVGQAVFETREAVQGKPLKLPTTACLRCVLREVDHHFLGKLTGDTTLRRPPSGYVWGCFYSARGTDSAEEDKGPKDEDDKGSSN